MRSPIARAALGVAVIAIAIVLLIVLKDDGDDGTNGTGGGAGETRTEPGGKTGKPTAPAIPTIVIEGGEPVGGVAELSYDAGDRIRFRVRSDVSDEIHLHGYDLMKDVEAGGSVSFDFPATIEGIFEAELEERGEEIAELRVNP